MTWQELMRIQGIDPANITRTPGVSDTQLGAMAGNGMSQNVLEAVLRQIFISLAIPPVTTTLPLAATTVAGASQ